MEAQVASSEVQTDAVEVTDRATNPSVDLKAYFGGK